MGCRAGRLVALLAVAAAGCDGDGLSAADLASSGGVDIGGACATLPPCGDTPVCSAQGRACIDPGPTQMTGGPAVCVCSAGGHLECNDCRCGTVAPTGACTDPRLACLYDLELSCFCPVPGQAWKCCHGKREGCPQFPAGRGRRLRLRLLRRPAGLPLLRGREPDRLLLRRQPLALLDRRRRRVRRRRVSGGVAVSDGGLTPLAAGPPSRDVVMAGGRRRR